MAQRLKYRPDPFRRMHTDAYEGKSLLNDADVAVTVTIPAHGNYRALIVASICIAGLTACGGSASNEANQAPRYPAGILADATSGALIKGIYPVTSTGESCCWLDADTAFRVPVDPDAKKLVLQVYVPPVGPLAKAPGTMTLTGVSDKPVERALHVGLQNVDFPVLQHSISNGTLSVRLHMSTAFVPSQSGINGDLRRLSVVLVSARTQ